MLFEEHVTRQYRAYSFGEPIDSCHFELVYRREEPTPEEYVPTGTTISSQLLRSNRLYCNYDNMRARGDRQCLQQLAFPPTSSTSSSTFAVSSFVFRTKVGRSLGVSSVSLRIPPRSREGGPVVTQCASQNSYCIFDGQEIGKR